MSTEFSDEHEVELSKIFDARILLADDQALLRYFGIFGPPTIAFFGTDGRERAAYRVVGYMNAEAFAARTREALHSPS